MIVNKSYCKQLNLTTLRSIETWYIDHQKGITTTCVVKYYLKVQTLKVGTNQTIMIFLN